jgi:hypothetical protein
MSVVSIAIVISFHIKNEPTPLELRMALPLGIIFWALAIACLALGFGNYIKTVTKYSRRMALVQTGWKTQVVRINPSLPVPHLLSLKLWIDILSLLCCGYADQLFIDFYYHCCFDNRSMFAFPIYKFAEKLGLW